MDLPEYFFLPVQPVVCNRQAPSKSPSPVRHAHELLLSELKKHLSQLFCLAVCSFDLTKSTLMSPLALEMDGRMQHEMRSGTLLMAPLMFVDSL